jgi:hypothetical protein
VFHYIRLQRLSRDKHSRLLDPFESCKEDSFVNKAPTVYFCNISMNIDFPVLALETDRQAKSVGKLVFDLGRNITS